jgi:hypothetical protein
MSGSKTSYDPTAMGGFGMGYHPPTVKNLVVYVEADYLMMFEKIQGQILAAKLGIACKF